MKKTSFLASAALVLLSACGGPQIGHGQLSALDKGMSPETVTARFQQPAVSVHTGVGGGRTFDFHRYKMHNGMHADLYLLAYERNRLVYWGYISEFRRQQDADLNSALSSVLPLMQVGK